MINAGDEMLNARNNEQNRHNRYSLTHIHTGTMMQSDHTLEYEYRYAGLQHRVTQRVQ